MTDRYDPQAIEAKWQDVWRAERAFNVPNPGSDAAEAAKTYVLEMLPYPSGELHMGHVRNYMLGEVGRTSAGVTATRFCGQWGWIRSACRRRMRRSSEGGAHASSPNATSLPSGRRWSAGLGNRLGPRPRHPRAGVLPVEQWVPEVLRARPRLSQRGPRQVVPERQTVLANEQVIDGHANAAERSSSRGTSSNGCSASRRTPMRCSTRCRRSNRGRSAS